MIASYNLEGMGDNLVIIINSSEAPQKVTSKGNIVKIEDEKNNKLLGINVLHASKLLPELKDIKGEVRLTPDDIKLINVEIKKAGFDVELPTTMQSPKFVVGYVKDVRPHPDTKHLKIANTQIDNNKFVQIVSSSPNMRSGIKVVVAKNGAMMPNGLIVVPVKLKGIDSNGMICSARELKLKGAPDKPGALILPSDAKVGSEFDWRHAKVSN